MVGRKPGAPLSRHAIAEYIANYDADIFAARQLRLIVVENATGNAAGAVDLYDFDPLSLRAGIGIIIDENARGHGFGTRALTLLWQYASLHLGMNQLWYDGNRQHCRMPRIHQCRIYDSRPPAELDPPRPAMGRRADVSAVEYRGVAHHQLMEARIRAQRLHVDISEIEIHPVVIVGISVLHGKLRAVDSPVDHATAGIIA